MSLSDATFISMAFLNWPRESRVYSYYYYIYLQNYHTLLPIRSNSIRSYCSKNAAYIHCHTGQRLIHKTIGLNCRFEHPFNDTFFF